MPDLPAEQPHPTDTSLPRPGERVTVHKLDSSGRVVVAYDAAVTARVPSGVQLDARWERPDLALPYTTFQHGARFREWFYTNRWFNVFEIHDRADALLGWYCNVAAPATMRGGVIACRDLYLDLWVAPDGDTLALDQDEFDAAADLDASTRAAALAALDELRILVARREPPFDAIGHPPAE